MTFLNQFHKEVTERKMRKIAASQQSPMSSSDFAHEKTATEGRYSNNTYEVWDLVPRNVLVDVEGDIFVVDAEIRNI